MEFMPSGQREVMGNHWHFMFAVGEIVAIAVVALLVWGGIPANMLWRIALGLGVVPALVIFAFRANLPEAAVWLVQRGRFREARRVTQSMYGDPLDLLPDQDVTVPPVKLGAFVAHLRVDPIRWRATLFGRIGCFAQSGEFSTFAFYIPVLFVLLGVSGNWVLPSSR